MSAFDGDRFNGLVSLVASEGGEGIEFLRRSLGGSRARLWLPTRPSAERVVAYCRPYGWRTKIMASLEMSAHRLSEDGFQVTVTMDHVNVLDLIEPARSLPGASLVLGPGSPKELPRG